MYYKRLSGLSEVWTNEVLLYLIEQEITSIIAEEIFDEFNIVNKRK